MPPQLPLTSGQDISPELPLRVQIPGGRKPGCHDTLAPPPGHSEAHPRRASPHQIGEVPCGIAKPRRPVVVQRHLVVPLLLDRVQRG